MAEDGELSRLVRRFIDRVVNKHDLSAVDEMVSPEWQGSGPPGWPSDIEQLRAFYEWQIRERPDWRIDIQGTLEVADCVVAHAHAGGTVLDSDTGATVKTVEWLAAYRFEEGLIAESRVLAIRDR